MRSSGGWLVYQSSEEVTEVEFRRFVANLGVPPGVGGVGYPSIVPAEELGRFVAEMRETIPDYAVFELDAAGARIPVARRPEYVPWQWLEPSDVMHWPR